MEKDSTQLEFAEVRPLSVDESLDQALQRVYTYYQGNLAKFFEEIRDDRQASKPPPAERISEAFARALRQRH